MPNIYFNHYLIHGPSTKNRPNGEPLPGPVLKAATIALQVGADTHVKYGISFCSEDAFNRRTGRKIALQRLLSNSWDDSAAREDEAVQKLLSNCHYTQWIPRVMAQADPSVLIEEDMGNNEIATIMTQWRETLYSQFTHCALHASQLKNTPHWFRKHLVS